MGPQEENTSGRGRQVGQRKVSTRIERERKREKKRSGFAGFVGPWSRIRSLRVRTGVGR